jgi:hypothetical protein
MQQFIEKYGSQILGWCGLWEDTGLGRFGDGLNRSGYRRKQYT